MRSLRYATLGLVLWCGFCLRAEATGLSYADNQVFSHGYVDFESAGPLVITDYPFASTGKKFAFQTSYRQLYAIRELTDNRAAVAVSIDRFSLGAALAAFGEANYFHQVGISSFVNYRCGGIAGGVAVVYHRYSFNEKYDALSLTTINAGFSYTGQMVTLFAATRAINQPTYYDGGESLPPEGEIGISLKSSEGLDSHAKALFIRYRKPTAELSQSFRLSDYAQINWALVLRPARFGAGLNLEHGHFGFDYRFSHHPVLGWTHTVMLTVFG